MAWRIESRRSVHSWHIGDDLRRVFNWPRGARVCAAHATTAPRLAHWPIAAVFVAAPFACCRCSWRSRGFGYFSHRLAPVFEPLAMRHSTSSGRGALVHASREIGVVEQDGLQRQVDDAAASLPPPPSSPSKQADVLHLLVGLLMQGAGLALSARIDRWAAGASHAAAERRAAHRGSSTSGAQTAVHWSPLLCNSLACAVVLALRMGEAARLIGGDDALLATKLRTSGCGALSVSGGLATLLITPSGDGSGADGGGGGGSPQQHLLQGSGDYGERGRERRSRLQSIRVIGLNLSLHALVAVATCILLPLLTSWASGEAAAEARSLRGTRRDMMTSWRGLARNFRSGPFLLAERVFCLEDSIFSISERQPYMYSN